MNYEHFILYHPESDSYMYAHSEDERDTLIADGELNDVTGQTHHKFLAEAQLGPFNPNARELIAPSETNALPLPEPEMVPEPDPQIENSILAIMALRQILAAMPSIILRRDNAAQCFVLTSGSCHYMGATLEAAIENAYGYLTHSGTLDLTNEAGGPGSVSGEVAP